MAQRSAPANANGEVQAQAAPGSRAQVEASARAEATPTPWVLVVEDDEGTRAVMGQALEDAGYVVAEASDGLGALEVLRVSPYRMVVLLDYWMPRVGGSKVIETVMADPALRTHHAYILVTATPEILPPAFTEQLAQLGAPVIAKPFEIDTLIDTVAQSSARLRGAS